MEKRKIRNLLGQKTIKVFNIDENSFESKLSIETKNI